MLKALDFNCDREDLGVVVPYGRWRYKYQPGIYLGLALHRLGRCLKSEGGEVCAITREDWKGDWEDFLARRLGKLAAAKARVVDKELQDRCQEARFRSAPPTCYVKEGCSVRLRFTSETYYPAIDWLHKLSHESVKVVLDQAVTEDRCGQVSTPLQWFWFGLSATNEELCKQLGQELVRLDAACPDVRSGPP
jgi:hypothetical protein